MKSRAALHEFLILNSICTALHFEEKAGVGGNNSPAFDENGVRIGNFPFMRYAQISSRDNNFRIYNVVTGKEININTFTFADHAETLLAASKMVMPDATGMGIYCLSHFQAQMKKGVNEKGGRTIILNRANTPSLAAFALLTPHQLPRPPAATRTRCRPSSLMLRTRIVARPMAVNPISSALCQAKCSSHRWERGL